MKKATRNQILAVAAKYDSVGSNGENLYAIKDGVKTVFAVSVYRDSFHILSKAGLLKYNKDYTYSAA